MDKLYFIVNPISGSGRGRRDFARVEALLRERGAAYEAVYSEHPGHAVALARAAVEAGERCIIAVGGGSAIDTAKAIRSRLRAGKHGRRDGRFALWHGQRPCARCGLS